jgi:hypothetical protein
MKRLVSAAGILVSAIALGLQLAGVIVPWVGWTIIAVTVLGVVGVLVAPPLWRWFAAAVVRSGAAGGVSLGTNEADAARTAELERAEREAAREERQREEERQRAHEQHIRQVRSALTQVRGELHYNEQLIQQATNAQRYWHPVDRQLVSAKWNDVSVLLSGEAGETALAYRAAEQAHHQLDRINHLVAERWARQPDEDNVPHVSPEDRLPDVLNAVRSAINSIDGALNMLA